MKSYSAVLISLLFFFLGCSNRMEKPKNLIDKDKMVDILYDLSLLEAIKAQNIGGGINTKKANEYIYKKYKIDSVQLAQSNKYYASDVDEYKKIFVKVKAKLDEQNKKLGNSVNGEISPTNPDIPQVQ
ncbi:DUF4296 domain-containing protein [Flavobacterium silvisoli]|uniref:DUF4296 domain-containing protein n=1 Tax=Flavobacterium silvisoli TaxID=2529433 RepID=A0A4Q9Z2R6_9FLAO|nr:DUF4296 domain-containing protein [Flavobacterium silvisoli]TBX70673.1 DUF4296 domain-containing protein [Flavobacterium silvisoli]